MASKELKRFNHYPEFKTENGIRNIIAFVKTGGFPDGLNQRAKKRYDTKFGANSGFKVIDDHLYYNPSSSFKLRVVFPSERPKIIRDIYDDTNRGLGTGLGQFYHQIAMTSLYYI